MVIITLFAVVAFGRAGEAQVRKPEKLQAPPIEMRQDGACKTATFAMG